MSDIRSLVGDVGGRLGRSARDVEPFVEALKDNWYDNADSIAAAAADDLASLGLPRRFAVELIAAAADWRGGGGGSRDKGAKGKSSSREKGKGKGKSKDEKGKGKSKGGKSGGMELRHTIPIDLEGIRSDFKFRPKLLGPKGTNVFHIEEQTGAKIELNGVDEDSHLEFVLVARDDESMDKAASMCEDLIETVFDDFEEHNSGTKGKGKKGRDSKGKSKGKEKGKGKGKEKGKSKSKNRGPREGEFEELVPIDTGAVDSEFGLRAKLVGLEGRNVHHIERSSGARVSVQHDDGDGMAFSIISSDQSQVDSAREMCTDLLETVLKEAGVVTKKRPQAASGKGGKGGKGKGKGKRKGKARDDDGEDDRPAKARRMD